MIESPPKLDNRTIAGIALVMEKPEVGKLIRKINDEYLYWSDVKYKRIPDGISHTELWAAVKTSRMLQRIFQWNKYGISVTMTNRMQQLCHEFDMNFGGSWGNNSIIPGENKEQYLISSLMEEAISSSQMEGATTTRKVAKDMLRKNITPKSRSEQMIYNNYRSIRFIVEHKNEALTPELLLAVHSLMTYKTLDEPGNEGRFRTDDEVVVENGITHEIVHTPPSHEDIPGFIDDLCTFYNSNESEVFIHPIVRAIIVHFMVAYVHPFVDGNGRTARALFYWHMLKNGYWLTEYLSISRIIYKSKASYEKSYLYAEMDGNDMSYFIAYNLRVLDLAFRELKLYIERKIRQKKNAINYLKSGGINERQASILSLMENEPDSILTVKEVQNRFSVSQPTAKSDLQDLVDKGFLDKIQINKKTSNYVRSENFDSLIGSGSRC